MEFTKRQVEIIEAACELIGEKGIQNLTTKSLAEQMNFSEPALYRHFKDKNEILKSTILYFREELNGAMEEIAGKPLNGLEIMEKVLQFQFGHFAKKPAIVMVIFAETSFQYNELLSETVHEVIIKVRERFIKIIEKGQADGSVRKDLSAPALVNIFMGSIRFTILQWRLSKYSTDLLHDGENLWHSLHTLFKSDHSE